MKFARRAPDSARPSGADRLVPASVALLFAWAYGLWLPLHLASEPHGHARGFLSHHHGGEEAGHTHPHAEDHDHAAADPQVDGAVTEEGSPQSHRHPLAGEANGRPVMTVWNVPFLERDESDPANLETPALRVPISVHDPPGHHAVSPPPARAPPAPARSPL